MRRRSSRPPEASRRFSLNFSVFQSCKETPLVTLEISEQVQRKPRPRRVAFAQHCENETLKLGIILIYYSISSAYPSITLSESPTLKIEAVFFSKFSFIFDIENGNTHIIFYKPESTVLDVFPSFSNMSCFVHL